MPQNITRREKVKPSFNEEVIRVSMERGNVLVQSPEKGTAEEDFSAQRTPISRAKCSRDAERDVGRRRVALDVIEMIPKLELYIQVQTVIVLLAAIAKRFSQLVRAWSVR